MVAAVSGQKDVFQAYLLQNDTEDFTFRGKPYHVEFAGADIFPQGFSAVANRLREFRGVNMLCDIGNGTMNIMYINNGKPISSKCFTEKYGTHQCMLAARERLMQNFDASVDDSIIEAVLCYGTADIDSRCLDVIRQSAAGYVFSLDKSDDRTALEYLQGIGKEEYKLLNRAVIAAVNDPFLRKTCLAADPYLETREKEDAFLRRVQETIEQSLRAVPAAVSTVPSAVPVLDSVEDFGTAMDFINGL